MGGDEVLGVLSALANPHRLRILAALSRRREYVSELARRIGMSRPLLHMHLKRLALELTPASISAAAVTLSAGAEASPRSTEGGAR